MSASSGVRFMSATAAATATATPPDATSSKPSKEDIEKYEKIIKDKEVGNELTEFLLFFMFELIIQNISPCY